MNAHSKLSSIRRSHSSGMTTISYHISHKSSLIFHHSSPSHFVPRRFPPRPRCVVKPREEPPLRRPYHTIHEHRTKEMTRTRTGKLGYPDVTTTRLATQRKHLGRRVPASCFFFRRRVAEYTPGHPIPWPGEERAGQGEV